ncbi:soluble quino protein glucose dehydrogenase [Aulographum hederae CBS 113979]|uniref:Soluble quino protein glucose dehydrogenase n=1 Tax=Aulographum hederae CBS 113979 TaxID=1176131 RepID=A0A6G1H8G4_9PEZI|nr:soluble quino protein glucose dehydrogenase [Aulographum hederae CBS 113979]
MHSLKSTLLTLALPLLATAQSSSCSAPTASYAAPSLASGYEAHLVATGLTRPRGIRFDAEGNLLVVQQRVGIVGLTFTEGGCGAPVEVADVKVVVDDGDLNHGIEMSPDGRTLYASSADALMSWDYDASSMSTTSDPQTLVSNMTNTDHTTRTLLLSKKAPGMMLISRGSTENVDPLASDVTSGHSQIRAFNLTNATGEYDYSNDGLMLGWGLRNSVGVDEDPNTGNLFSVENSVDQLTRDGEDVHEDNPGEELNFHGTLIDNQDDEQGGNYGYPECFAAWAPNDLPRNGTLVVGSQFAIGNGDSEAINDLECSQRVAPRLTLLAHMAPLDIKFNSQGSTAWITMHGSWDRTNPVGYKLSMVAFSNGQPTAAADSTTALIDIMANPDNSACPRGCFRPVGLAWDSQGRLFMSSDSTGEIYVITRTGGGGIDDAEAPTETGQGAPAPSTTEGAAPYVGVDVGMVLLLGGLAAVVPVLM